MIKDVIAVAVLALAASLAGCGGGGGSDVPAPTVRAGQLEPTFGNGGVFELTSAAFAAVQARANSITVDTTGRLLVAGWTAPLPAVGPADALFVRVLASGALDSTFGTDGTVRAPMGGHRPSEGRWAFPAASGGATLVQTSPATCAKIGLPPPPPPCNQFLPSQVDVLRLLPDGTRDGVFGTTGFGPMQDAESRLQPDGSVVVLGIFSGVPQTGIALRRIDANGRPDFAFGDNADVALRCPELPTNSFHVATMAGLGSGKFLVARKNTSSSAGNPIRACITRLNADGTLDASWGAGGRMYIDGAVQTGASLVALLERSDGGVALVLNENVVGRECFGAIAWLTADGAVDTSRGVAGVTSPIALGAITAAAMQADGKIVLSGWPYDAASANVTDPFAYDRPRLLRLDAAGQPDTAFGAAGDGVAMLVSAGRFVHPMHIALAADGSIFVAGFTAVNIRAGSGEASRLAVAKLTGVAR